MIAPADFHHPRFGYTTMQSTAAQGESRFLQELEVDLMCSQDTSGQYRSFYWRQAEQYDLTSEQVIGVPLNQTFHPIALDAYRDRIQRILENRTPERCIHDFCYGDQVFPFELVISPILQSDGQATQVWVMGHLLPEGSVQKVIDSLVPLSVDPNQKLLTQIARRIRRTLDLDTIWQQTVDSLGKALQVSRCIICSYRPDYAEVKVEAEYRQDSLTEMLGMTLELESEAILKQALWSSEPVVVDQIVPSRFQEKSLLVVSTSYKDEPNGVISLQQCDRHRPWSDAEIELVRELAEQVGTAIAHGTLYKELELAREQAEEVSRLKSEFLASTSHELRTPLNGMIGFLKLILEGMADDPEEQREFIQEAHNSALHLLNIINDILDIAKIEAGKMELLPREIHLSSFISGVAEVIRIKAEEKGLAFCCATDPNLPSGICVDDKRLRQVILNLLGNATKFTDEGEILFSVIHTGDIPPVSTATLRFEIRDTGVGMTPDQIQKIFLPFEQVGANSRKHDGTGLGLAITRQIVQMMGGQIEVESQYGVGSQFSFEINVPVAQDWAMSSTKTEQGKIINYVGTRKKVLVVDDKMVNRKVIAEVLSPLGFELAEAENGQLGLEQYERFQPDFIITDLVMPELDGFEMVRQLRQNGEDRVIILASSASVLKQDQDNSLVAGCNDFLPKPIDVELLLHKLKKHLHLTWVYEEVLTDASSASSKDSRELVYPPQNELQELLQCASVGDIEGIETEVIRLGTLDPKYRPFCDRITDLASEFDDQGIVDFIHQAYPRSTQPIDHG